MARYRPEHDIKLLSGTHLSVQVSIDIRITGTRISTVTEAFTRVCVGQDNGEVRGADRSVACGRHPGTSLSLRTQRFHQLLIFFFACLWWTGLDHRAYTAEKHAISFCTQDCEACRCTVDRRLLCLWVHATQWSLPLKKSWLRYSSSSPWFP